MLTQSGREECRVVGTCVGVVAIADAGVGWATVPVVMAVAMTCDVAGDDGRILNVSEPRTSWIMPATVTIYSSGLNVDASMSNDHWLRPSLPGITSTTPLAPDYSPLSLFLVGAKDDE